MVISETPQPLSEVFPRSGVPKVTFVAPVEYARLKVALLASGRGIVIEGPSGIGKTTALKRAIADLNMGDEVLELKARKKSDRTIIADLPARGRKGVIIIDDFHRLDTETRSQISDYLKVLADESDEDTKLVILGINKAGESLITFGRDVAARLEIIRFEREPDDHVGQLIQLGADALNVEIGIASEIIAAANGSFSLAQHLSQDACLCAGVVETQVGPRKPLEVSFELVNGRVMDQLAAEFGQLALDFARGGRLKREGRAPYLHLLRWLSEAHEWFIHIDREMDAHQSLKGSVNQVVTKGYLSALLADKSKGLNDVLHFDPATLVLSVEDPKFYYYIRNLAWNKFAAKVGYLNITFSDTYDYALSFAGVDRKLAEDLFDALTEHELAVFYDKNEQSRILAENVEEYLDPIYRSEASFIVCLLSQAYPTRIWTKLESDAFKTRFGEHDVIPIWFKDATRGMFDTTNNVGGVDYDPDGDHDTQVADMVKNLVAKVGERRLKQAAEILSSESAAAKIGAVPTS
jgi:hypothetical protein